MAMKQKTMKNAMNAQKIRNATRPPKVKTLIAFSSLIMLLFCVFVVYQASKAYEASIEDGRVNAERLTNILADEIELTFLAVDLTLRRVVERHYFNMLFGSNLSEDLEHNLRMWVDETPQIAAIVMTNDKGDITIAAFKRGYQNHINLTESFKNQPIFQSLSEDNQEDFGVTRLSGNDSDLLLLARRNDKIDGTFGGIVFALVDPAFFESFFTSVDTGNHRLMSLFLENGELIFAGPADQLKQSTPRITNWIKERMLPSVEPDEVLINTQTIHKEIEVLSVKKLNNLPLILGVAINENDFLLEWRDARIKDISFLAIFTIFGSVLSFFALTMAKQIMRVEESEAAAILASQAKSDFLANMSHELRTPLNAIIGFSEMINAGYFGTLNDKQSERIHDINLCGSHLLQLITDILEFSKGEAGKLELHEESFELPEILDECVRMIQEKARSKHIKIMQNIPQNLPAITADKRKIRQIVLNLLSNSIKFTPDGGQITLNAKKEVRSGAIELAVRDNGIGIPENEIQKALSVFGQVHRSQSHEGTGLGLPLCKMFAELHGGKLTLTSKVGEGTTVTVTIPPERVVN